MKQAKTQVGVRALKASLSRYLADVERGAVVTVTHRGKVIARIVPGADAPATAAPNESADVASFDRLFAGKPKAFDVRALAPTRTAPGRKRTGLARAILADRR